MRVRVKICGITNIDDAVAAVDAGADALGFIFFERSPRNITRTAAAEIIKDLPPFVARVGVFVNETPEAIRQTIADCGLDTVQLHGDEPPFFSQQLPARAIKAFRVKGEETLQAMSAYKTEAWLLDTYAAGKMGGTGLTLDWSLARRAVQMSRMVILAGGLNPGNVEAAAREVRPFGVDVSSGVESAPGRKDHSKVRDFIQAAANARF